MSPIRCMGRIEISDLKLITASLRRMALISTRAKWRSSLSACRSVEKKYLDTAGVVREAIYRPYPLHMCDHAALWVYSQPFSPSAIVHRTISHDPLLHTARHAKALANPAGRPSPMGRHNRMRRDCVPQWDMKTSPAQLALSQLFRATSRCAHPSFSRLARFLFENGHRIGALRIEVFLPDRKLCVDAVQKLKIPIGVPCADSCQEMIDAYAYSSMTEALEQDLRGLQSLGAEALLVDLTNNGGGSESAEAVARMITSKQLASEPFGYVRGPHWQKQWADLAADLTGFAKSADPIEQARLEEWAAVAGRAARNPQKTVPFRAALVAGLAGHRD